ncbi:MULTISPECIES: hypothetical protein [Pseudomonas aeruginosa group]|uniref:hypothetical protein n=1 Tax=Pseudomonas aeruginosa group TaxID=136841 RepID=UPI001F261F20|nr:MULTISPECIES: hypothetical protein [Pseudomonas aeruginosa group]MCW8021790.1 hypothetical protein [Pseudomonas aeruginosa]
MSLQAGKLPRFSDVSWRWIAYCSSAAVLGGVVFAFVQEVELKRDVPCEIVSPSELKITGHEGLVTRVLVAPGQPVREGQPLFELSRDLTLSSDGTPRPKFDERMRDAKLATIEAQFVDRRSALSARLQAGELSEMARTRELQALDRQRSRARQLVRDTRATLERLQGLADYVTAERLEQARARQHQSEADAAQGDARRLSLQAEIETLRGARHELQAQIAELDAQRRATSRTCKRASRTNARTSSSPRPGTAPSPFPAWLQATRCRARTSAW